MNNDADAEDVIDEVFLTAWEKRDQVRDITKISSWLYRITMNTTITMCNKRRREMLVPEVPDNQFYMMDNEVRLDIRGYIRKLKPEHRNIIVMFYLKDMTIDEIAAHTGLKEGTVKSRLHRARSILKEMMEDI